jgi:rhodanese-related sulfurtransferase
VLDARRHHGGDCSGASHRLPVAGLNDVVRAVEGAGPMLVDVREAHEYHHGRVPTAVNLPLSRLDEALAMDAEAFALAFGFARPQRDQPLLVYCMKGVRSQLAQARLLRAGFHDVRNYSGSYSEWAASGQPVEEPAS